MGPTRQWVTSALPSLCPEPNHLLPSTATTRSATLAPPGDGTSLPAGPGAGLASCGVVSTHSQGGPFRHRADPALLCSDLRCLLCYLPTSASHFSSTLSSRASSHTGLCAVPGMIPPLPGHFLRQHGARALAPGLLGCPLLSGPSWPSEASSFLTVILIYSTLYISKR